MKESKNAPTKPYPKKRMLQSPAMDHNQSSNPLSTKRTNKGGK